MLRDLVAFGRVAARAVVESDVLGSLRPRGFATLARRLVQRSLPSGPTAVLSLYAAHEPDREALIDEEGTLHYGELDAEVDALARGLAALGVRPGDRVAIMMPNARAYLLVQWATLRAHAGIVQIGYRLKATEVAHVLGNARPRLLVCHEDHEAVVRKAIDLAGSDAQVLVVPAEQSATRGALPTLRAVGRDARVEAQTRDSSASVMVYTSGTTGKPKGAARAIDRSLGPAVFDFIQKVGIRHDERHLVVCPLYHSAAPAFVALTYGLGGTVILREHFDPEDVLATIERHRVTSAFFVPTMLGRLAGLPIEARRRHDLSSLRWLMNGAAPLPTETARRIGEWLGPILFNFYGATETGLVTLAGPGDHLARPGTIGRALLGNEIRLLDDEGREVLRGEVGEIWVRSAMLVDGYHEDPGATARSLKDGFFSVGDVGRVDEAGFYYLADRKADMVITGGVNVYPQEIEQHLHHHPAVLECAVIGVPDDDWGESLRGFVVLRPDAVADEDELRRWCKDGLADFKCPKRFSFVSALPRNPTGKVLKRELREAARLG
ncbi:MAG: AMP-binding protein [Myxococcales bacterium]|nr:AMP-binding protein [Myxococcales bacterium]